MSQYREHSTRARAKSRSCPTPSTLQDNMPHLDALFVNLDRGITPNLFDFLNAIEEMVAFHTDCDQVEQSADCQAQNMSQIKCRFCS